MSFPTHLSPLPLLCVSQGSRAAWRPHRVEQNGSKDQKIAKSVLCCDCAYYPGGGCLARGSESCTLGGPVGGGEGRPQRWAAVMESFFPTLALGQLRPTPWHVAWGSRSASAGERMREAGKASSHGSRLSFLHRANLRIPFLLSESREGSVQGWALLPRPLSHICTQSHRWFQRCPPFKLPP